MNKPVLTPAPEISMLTVQQYERYNPTAFNDSLTILEKMNKMIYQLNNIGVITNDLVDQWNTLIKWILGDGLNDIVAEEIQKKIDDGTFNDLFDSLLGSLSDLTTIDKSTIVAAINEVNKLAVKSTADIGDISTLTTDAKDNLVNAINEIKKQEVMNRLAPLMIAEATGHGIISGFKVTQQPVLSMAVNVGNNTEPNIVHMKDGLRYELPSISLPIEDANATQHRYDAVYVSQDGILKVMKGTNGSPSVSPPVIPIDGELLAYVYVQPLDTTINNVDITDKRELKALKFLKTVNQSNLVQAINEVIDDLNEAVRILNVNIGDLTQLPIIQTSVVDSIVAFYEEFKRTTLNITDIVGLLSDLTTDDKTSIVNSINWLQLNINTKLGDLTLLDTTTKVDLVSSINEVLRKAINNEDKIGDLSLLPTDDKTNIVKSIIEVVKESATKIEVGDLNNLPTTVKTSIVDSIIEIVNESFTKADAGDLTLLKTTDKDTLVNAINSSFDYFNRLIGDMTTLKTANKNDLVGAVNEVFDSIDSEITVKLKQLVTNVKDYGAKGDRVTDDTQAFKDALKATPAGGTLFIPVGFYVITDELTIEKAVHFTGALAEDQGHTYLEFNLNGKPTNKAAIRVLKGVNGCLFERFYMSHKIASLHNGLFLDGKGLGYADAIWYTKFNDVYVRGFNDNFRATNVCIASYMNCRSINATGNGFSQTEFATGVTFYSCYAQDSLGDGFKMHTAFYSGAFSCYSDGNARGFHFESSYGVFVRDCGSESCRLFAISCLKSVMNVDGISVVESGMSQGNKFQPTVVYVESGNCNIANVSEERLHSTNLRLYTILYEQGATGNVWTTGHELLDIYIPYDGSCTINGQLLTEGVPTKKGWKQVDIGRIAYIKTASEEGTTPNKHIKYGYRRMTVGDGNALSVDWLPLIAKTEA